MNEPITTLDTRYSEPDGVVTSWEQTRRVLETAELFWLSTVRTDGRPHVTPVVAVWHDGTIHFSSADTEQKAINLRRDPRLTCLVEAGERYDELRGVQIKGQAVISDDYEMVQRIGEMIWERYTGPLNENTRSMVITQAAKRVVVIVKPVEIVSWDHRKLGGGY